MKKFIHPNIVSLLGKKLVIFLMHIHKLHVMVTTIGHCEATGDGAPMMILELMQYGDLKCFLKTNR